MTYKSTWPGPQLPLWIHLPLLSCFPHASNCTCIQEDVFVPQAQAHQAHSHHRSDVPYWILYLITVLVGLVCYKKRLGDLKNRNLFFTVLRLGSSKSRCQSIQLLVRNLVLACRLSPSYCTLTLQRVSNLPSVSSYMALT